MLLLRSRWHFAANRLPTGEARLLGFANGGGDAESEDTMRRIGEGMDPMQSRGERTSRETENIERGQQDVRSTAQETVTGGGGVEKHQSAEDIAKRVESTEHATRELLHLFNLTEVKEDASLFAGLTNEEQEKLKQNEQRERERAKVLRKQLTDAGEMEAWGDITHWLSIENDQMARLKTSAKDLEKWQRGELPPREFIAAMRILTQGNDDATLTMQALDAYAREHAEECDNYGPPVDEEATLSHFDRWNSGQEKPSAFFDGMTRYYAGQPGGEEAFAAMQAVMSQHAESINLWEATTEGGAPAINESTKQQIIREMNRAANVDHVRGRIAANRALRKEMDAIANTQKVLSNVDARTQTLEAKLKQLKDNIEKRLEEAHRKQAPHEQEAQGHGHGRGFFAALGIKFYSVNDIMEAFHQVKEAYVKTYQDHVHHQGASLAKLIGDVAKKLPFADGMDIVLSQQLESANKKTSNEFKEYCTEQNFTFKQLFTDPGCLFETEHHDVNHTRGILEYAASRGWLYDIDQYMTDDRKKVLGHDLHTLLHDWNDTQVQNYYTLLRGQNASGREEEINKGEKRVHDIENIPFDISEIDRELGKGNIWAAVGFAQRAIERGLISEVTPWISTAFFRRMREDPVIRKFMPRMALDKVGALSLYRTAFTLGHFKGERPLLEQWLKTDKDVSEAGTLGKVISQIERDIASKCSMNFATHDNKRILDRLVARVLSTNILSADMEMDGKPLRDLVGWQQGKTVSILQGEYAEYRNSGFIRQLGDLVPGVEKEDSDYYTGRTENMLTSTKHIDLILEPSGRGLFSHSSRAANFMARTLEYYQELESKGLHGEAETFRREIGAKLSTWAEKTMGDSRSPGLEKEKLAGSIEMSNKSGLNTLLYEGFIDVEPIIDGFFYSRGGSELARAMLEDNSAQTGTTQLLVELKDAKAKYSAAKTVPEQRAAMRERTRILAAWRARLQGATGRPPILERAGAPGGADPPAPPERRQAMGGAGEPQFSQAV